MPVSNSRSSSKYSTSFSPLRLWIRVIISGKRPRVLSVTGFDFELFDTEDQRGASDLVLELAGWLAEFPAPQPAGKAPGGQLILLGNPAKANLSDLPADWSAKLILLSSALGMSFRGIVSHHEANSFPLQSLITSVDSDITRAAERSGVPAGSIAQLTRVSESFGTLLYEITELLLASKQGPEDETPRTSRELKDGEKVFHRKIGNSRKFDLFDAGSPTPCQHNIGGYFRVHGPKSTKGMARRYSNFQPDMLFHCGKYPNCGMYAVFNKD